MTDAKSRVTTSTQLKTSRIAQKVKHDKYNNKCVCEICLCGIHRCPPSQRRRFQGSTTNQDFYKPYKIEADSAPAPTYQIRQRRYDPEALQTTYNVQYTPKKGSRLNTDYQERSVEYMPRKTPFYGETQYNNSYFPKPIRIQNPESSYQYRPNKAKFQGTTSYNAQFTPKRPVTQNSQSQIVYQRKSIPFTGETAYHQQFRPYKIVSQEPEMYTYRPNTAKFLGQSRYAQDFHAYPKSNYKINNNENCPIYELAPYPPSCSPGKRHLYYSAQKDYWQ